jgi:predicted Holliday junction resolvase-like endonuclease
MSIIGIILGVIAIGLFIWLKKDQKMSNSLHEGDLIAAKHAYEALMNDFNNYQITNERKIAKLEKDMEIRFKSRDRRMDNMNKSLPSIIGQVVGQIELAQDTINRQM